RVRLGL
ncbi:hypothetical protein BN1723_020390, partial [Verticillium longisporum]